MRRAYSCRAAAAVFSDDARTQKCADGMLSALECLDAHRNIGPIIAQRLCAVNSRQKQCRAVSAKAVQSGISAGWRFYIYGRVGFLKIRGSAVLRSIMPACSGQAAENCLDRGTQANLSGGTKRLCPAILDAEDGKVPPIAAVRLAAGGWPHAAPKPYGHTLLPSRPSAALAAGPCLEHSRKEGQRRGGKWLCAPLRECEKCTRGPCWGRGCGRAEHRRHSARLYTISCCVLTDSHTTNIVFTMAHT